MSAIWNGIVDQIKAWWAYSRTVFMNISAALLMILNEVLPYLLGLDYDALFTHEISVLIGLGVNLLNIWLRTLTVAPVGQKPVVVAPVVVSEAQSQKAD